MQINVSQQLKASIGSARNYEIDGVVGIAGSACRVEGKIKLIRTNRSILAKGTLYTEIKATCSRCLSLFIYPLSLSIEEEYFPVTDVSSGASLSLPEEPGCFTIDEHHVLDLTEAIQQYAILAIPMKPLCREDCAGLCPHCGNNLNQGPCHCLPQQTDDYGTGSNELAFINGITVKKSKERE